MMVPLKNKYSCQPNTRNEEKYKVGKLSSFATLCFTKTTLSLCSSHDSVLFDVQEPYGSGAVEDFADIGIA